MPPADVSPRGVAISVVNRLLRGARCDAPRGMSLLWGARYVLWSPETHPFITSDETRRAVRALLMLLCRRFGVAAGSEVAKRVLCLVFAHGDVPSPTPLPEEADEVDEVADSSDAEPHPHPDVLPHIDVAALPPPPPRLRPRFAFLLPSGDAGEGRGVLLTPENTA
jgi:hypothetical protein